MNVYELYGFICHNANDATNLFLKEEATALMDMYLTGGITTLTLTAALTSIIGQIVAPVDYTE